MERNRMGTTGACCNDQGYVCDFEPKLHVSIRSVVDPSTGLSISSQKDCHAFYECRHCHQRKTVMTKTLEADEIVTFDMLLAERRDQLAEAYYASQNNQTRSGR